MVSPDSGSNPSDDEGPATLQDNPDNLTRAEIEAEIEDLEPDQQAELVALMWIGRGDMEPEEWEEALELAAERHEGRPRPTCSRTRTSPTISTRALDRLLDGTDLMETGRVLRSELQPHYTTLGVAEGGVI